MKRHCSLMVLLFCLLVLPAFAVRAQPATAVPPDLSGLEGWEVTGWCVPGGGDQGFLALKKGGQNVLAGCLFRDGVWQEEFRNPNAFPQGEMRMVLVDVSGDLRIAIHGDEFDFGSKHWGTALLSCWSNGEFDENLCIFEQDQDGRWQLSFYAHSGQSGLMNLTDSELTYFEAYEDIHRIKVAVNREIRLFEFDKLPMNPQQAAQPDALPPKIPDGWLSALEIPLEGKGMVPVFSAPDKNALRGADGKAALSHKGWVQVFGREGDAVLVQYAIGPDHFRFGYIPLSSLPSWHDPVQLDFSPTPALTLRPADATDDPLGGAQPLVKLKPGEEVLLLSRMDDWAYFEGRHRKQAYRAFAPLSVFNTSPQPPQGQREATIILEGQAETVLQSRYRDQSRHFALWYETQAFEPFFVVHGAGFSLKNNQLGKPVYLTVENMTGQPEGSLPGLEEIRNTYERDGWVCEPLDTANLLPGFQLPGQPPQAFLASQEEQITRVILTQAGSGQYLITLTYPREAAEGWGARMDFMLSTLEETALP